MPDITEMLAHSLVNRDFPLLDAQRAHQFQRILIGVIGRTEAGHGDAEDIAARLAHHIDSLAGDQQRQRGIQPAGNADDRLAAGDRHAAGQRSCLQAEDLPAALGALGLLRRNKGLLGYLQLRFGFLRQQDALIKGFIVNRAVIDRRSRVHERFGRASAGADALHVDIGGDDIIVVDILRIFLHDRSAARRQRMTGANRVGGGFAQTGGYIHIGALKACRLLLDRLAAVFTAGNHLIHRGKVDDHLRTGQRKRCARLHGSEQVAADFHADAHVVIADEDDRLLYTDGVQVEAHPAGVLPCRGAEPAFFRSGQARLWHNGSNTAAVEHHGAVIQAVRESNRRAYDRRHALGAVLGNLTNRAAHLAQQRFLEEQVAARRAGQRKLREHNETGVHFFCLAQHLNMSRRVFAHVAQRKMRYRHGYTKNTLHTDSSSICERQQLRVNLTLLIDIN